MQARPLGQYMPGGLVGFLALLATVGSFASADAQVNRGTIRAQEGQVPVPGARVTVTDSVNTVLAEAVSGPDGKFIVAFSANRRFVVGVRKIGWQPSFSDLITAAATDTMLVDFLVPAEPTELAAAEINANAATTLSSRALAEAKRKGWKVYSPEVVNRFRDVAGSFTDLMREAGTSGIVIGKGDCVRSVRSNRCLTFVVDGQPAGTNVFIHPRDIDFYAVLSASESAVIWGDRAAWGAIVVYTRMYTEKPKP